MIPVNSLYKAKKIILYKADGCFNEKPFTILTQKKKIMNAVRILLHLT